MTARQALELDDALWRLDRRTLDRGAAAASCAQEYAEKCAVAVLAGELYGAIYHAEIAGAARNLVVIHRRGDELARERLRVVDEDPSTVATVAKRRGSRDVEVEGGTSQRLAHVLEVAKASSADLEGVRGGT